MSCFWPPSEPSQGDYERLRGAVINSGRLPDDLTAARFARRGLPGLITWPDAEVAFSSVVVGAARAAWTPYGDPRVGVLAATYRFLLEGGPRRKSPADNLAAWGS
jgi:hypothetical protein